MSGTLSLLRRSRAARPAALAAATAAALSLLGPFAAVAGDANLSGVSPGTTFERFIVKYKDGSTAQRDADLRQRGLDAAAQALDTRNGRGPALRHQRRLGIGFDVIGADRPLDSVQAAALIRRLAADPQVESVQADALARTMFTPNDSLYPQQWHYFNATGGLNLPAAWDNANGSGVTVAVIDSGILSHADLNANIVSGYDFVSSTSAGNGGSGDGNGRDGDPTDSSNVQHGTHVAGTVAAVTHNGTGVAGVAFGSKVSPLRVLGNGGFGSISDIADAITWASGGSVPGAPGNPNPAKVINLSLGGSGTCDPVYQTAINGAVSRGTVVVIAAGNSNSDVSGFRPANCANVVAVAANDIGGNRAAYSNYGGGIDVTAPGGETAIASQGVLSTVGGGGYAWYQGTSMAAPHVAGVAALILGKASRTPAEIESILKSTARALPGSCPGGCGTGIVNAAAAVARVLPPPSFPGPTACGRLLPGEGLNNGTGLNSCDNRFHLAMQTDGNLVLYAPGGALWASNTGGIGPSSAVLQGDGNFVVYTGGFTPTWSSGTWGQPVAQLLVQDDGNVVIYSTSGVALWNSGTGGH
ncbi:S8 family serine peptidase [Lysobacter sp. CA199]|uniref:S8 family serine peptidase n=1 Tax=Lysobacter sp. CA199 TaxID=3455608 RepID=UPI003F8D1E08